MSALLSDDARAIAGGIFGSPSPIMTTLRFEYPKEVTKRAFDALCELVEAEILSCVVTDSAVTYRPLVDCSEHYTWLRENMQLGIGRFAISTRGIDASHGRAPDYPKRAGAVPATPEGESNATR